MLENPRRGFSSDKLLICFVIVRSCDSLKKTRNAGFPAFFVPPSRPRGADKAERSDATEGQEGGTGKMRFAFIRDYSRWDFSCIHNQ
jgi:hypothetical protein